ncbi:MAG TPA: Gfo/Idh/MocA family oxidoreductase [Opitutus sp.]|nr:Gfo/Idh/MocA family oxidoreductase [Opitutus sp.]
MPSSSPTTDDPPFTSAPVSGPAGALSVDTPLRRPPRLGFAGVGWIGRNRLEAIAASGLAKIAAITDRAPAAVDATRPLAPTADVARDFAELLAMDLDGIVIATPNALHVEQSIAALRAGKAVFCQKPLARTAAETREVLSVAHDANRLLGVDLSYRFTAGMQRIRRLIRDGELGTIYAAELVFHNAYGPDKSWFYDPALAGGGCLLDLGIHLIDLALWCLDFPDIDSATAQLLVQGQSLKAVGGVEDYAAGQLTTTTGVSLQLACSWRAPAGCDARIEATFFGTQGGASFHNVNGSFYDFVAERFRPDRSRELLSSPPDAWGGRAAVAWARQLSMSPAFDPSAKHLQLVATALDRLYGRES